MYGLWEGKTMRHVCCSVTRVYWELGGLQSGLYSKYQGLLFICVEIGVGQENEKEKEERG